MDPFFIFKSSGVFTESWILAAKTYHQTLVGASGTGWINDELAFVWLDSFHEATIGRDRTKKGEKRYVIFDGHGAHLTLGFLQKMRRSRYYRGFVPHSTHLSNRLKESRFLAINQHFRSFNHDLSSWAGEPVGKSDFLRIIWPIRQTAFNQRIISESFKYSMARR